MFSNSVATAIVYAKHLEEKKIRLSLTGQSHLGVLMSYSSPDNPQVIETEESFIDRISDVVINKGGTSEHEMAISTIVDELAPLVQGHIRVAKEIGQMAGELSESVKKYLEGVPTNDASGAFNIEKDELPSVYDEPYVQNMIEEVSFSSTPFPKNMFCTGPRDFDGVFNYLITGNQSLDEKIKELVSSYDKDFLEKIWYGFFSNMTIGRNSENYCLSGLRNLVVGERLAVSFIVLTIASKLLGNIPSDSIGSLSEFEDGLYKLKCNVLQVMKSGLDEYNYQLNNKVMVLAYRGYEKKVIVNGVVYREWLNNGGSPELILGSLLSKNSAYSISEFSEKPENFLRQWNAYCSLHNAESDLKRATFFRSIYLTCFTDSVCAIVPFEEQFRKNNLSFAESVIDRAEDFLRNASLSDLTDVLQICLELVAGIRFDYTPAKFILKDIDSTVKLTPDIDPREASLVATAKYISSYFSNILGVTKV